MKFMGRVKTILEIMGGSAPIPAMLAQTIPASMALGAWWLVLLITVLIFSGGDVKFIYIDF